MSSADRLYTTAAGHRRYLERVAKTRSAYDRICASNEDAAGAGDNCVWHDNFAYEENQRQMHQTACRLRDQQMVAARMSIVRLPRAPQRVCLGCAVVVENGESGERKRWVIGGYEDGDMAAERLSYTAPLARALLGRTAGDEAWFESGAGRVEFEIISIEASEPGEL
jgi:transcription elongation GreA/GreB family factor